MEQGDPEEHAACRISGSGGYFLRPYHGRQPDDGDGPDRQAADGRLGRG